MTVAAAAGGDEVELSPRTREMVLRVRAGYAPPPELRVSEFADRELIVTTGPLAQTKWQTDFAPYQRGILDVFHALGIEIAVVQGSSQWGKTSCAVCLAAYHIRHDPCPIQAVLPTVDPMAKDFARNRLEPVIEASPALREVVAKKRAKDQSNTILSKTFKGGSIAIGGANSAASLAARSTRVLLLDEVDRYPLELPGEGNTMSIALKRTQAYRRRRRVLITSSPTLKGGTIDTWFQRGDQRHYFVPCPACGHMHRFEWRNVVWKNEDARTARLRCPSCEHLISDAERVAVLIRGEWRAARPDRPERHVASFHLWEAYSPLSSLPEIVSGFLHARKQQKAGDHSEMHTWQNTTLGEPIELDAGEGVEPHTLIARREVPEEEADMPAGAVCLTMGVDTQDDRLELLVTGWGIGEECWLVDRLTLPGDTSRLPEPGDPESQQASPWKLLDEALDREYLHPSGQALGISSTCIDSAGHRTTQVYSYASRRAARRVQAIIGRDSQRPIVSAPSKRRWGREKRVVYLYTIGVDAAKALLKSRLELTDHGPGFIHIPIQDWADEELALQLTSERLITRHVQGAPVQSWRKVRARNEALDCWVYALGALRLLHPNLPLMSQRLSNPAAAPAPPTEQPPPRRPWIRRRRGWLR